MKPRLWDLFCARDLQGMGRLTVEAVRGMTDLVEALHHAITHLSALRGAPKHARTKGVTGMVYRHIRSVTSWVGAGLDPVLAQFADTLGRPATAPGREAVLAALNGVLGDHLAARGNPLAITMQPRRDGRAIDAEALGRDLPRQGPGLLILVHGLCMNDLQWHRHGHDHGAALARDTGLTPVYLHYNTGRHTSENGRMLADLLEDILQRMEAAHGAPVPLTLVAHSMGGLVTRSAVHAATEAGHGWPQRLQKGVFLGTPHHGSPWEQGGNLIDLLLDANPYSAPFSRLGKLRSSGITDLRYGHVLDADWQGRDRFEASADHRTPVPLPPGIAWYAMAGRVAPPPDAVGDTLLGDGLVGVDSALGRHPDPRFNLAFPEDRQWVGDGLNHLDLLSHPAAYRVLREWLTPST